MKKPKSKKQCSCGGFIGDKDHDNSCLTYVWSKYFKREVTVISFISIVIIALIFASC